MFVYCVYFPLVSCMSCPYSFIHYKALTVWLIAGNFYRLSSSPRPHGGGKTEPAPDIRLSSQKHARLRLCPAPTRASGNFVMLDFHHVLWVMTAWTCLFIRKTNEHSLLIIDDTLNTIETDTLHISRWNWDTREMWPRFLREALSSTAGSGASGTERWESGGETIRFNLSS